MRRRRRRRVNPRRCVKKIGVHNFWERLAIYLFRRTGFGEVPGMFL